jgi:hypothetical protein
LVGLEVALDHVHLYFQPGDKRILKRGVARSAFLCPRCGMFVMPAEHVVEQAAAPDRPRD